MYYNSSDLMQIREAIQSTLSPVVALLAIYMIFGLFGNIIVIIYYGFKLKPNPSFMFIVSMAICDLVVCCISMPLEIVDILEFYTFPSVAACKLLRFVSYFASCASASFLLWIAIDRYKKLCKPFGNNISIYKAKIIIVMVLLVDLIVTCPNFLFYEVVDINITNSYGIITPDLNLASGNGVIGHDCKTHDRYKLYVTIYHGILFLLFLIIVISLVVLYYHVVKRMVTMESFRKESITSIGNDVSISKQGDIQEHFKSGESNELFKNDNKHEKCSNIDNLEKCTNDQQLKDSDNHDKEDAGSKRKPSHDNHFYTRKFTFIGLAITTAFIGSFLPYLGLMVWQTLSQGYKQLGGSQLVAYHVFIRSWLLNSVVNPFIYGFFNRHFRTFVFSAFENLKVCCSKKRQRNT